MKKIFIEEENVIIQNMILSRSKKIPLNTLIYYSQYKEKRKNGVLVNEYTLFFPKDIVTVDRDVDHIGKVIRFLKDKKKDKQAYKRHNIGLSKSLKKLGYISIIISFFSFVHYLQLTDLQGTETSSLQGYLQEDIYFKSNGKSYQCFLLLKEYPNVRFNLNKKIYYEIPDKFRIKNNFIGIDIAKNDYTSKISKKSKSMISEYLSLDLSEINVISIEINNSQYSLYNSDEELENNIYYSSMAFFHFILVSILTLIPFPLKW
ncbi:hypothetical protein [Flammeovirga aprica]|uniref:Uncharacterized protein n=1 Tax=Flammeovirga aprica JL-4 TaxID=694437 RepID=A0A7X9S0Z4_9BACT|nr:hypothetical protein [Flammeovirga aprica]NME72157.1 hypothetical protein [Flammeovirga aprica JL-4]